MLARIPARLEFRLALVISIFCAMLSGIDMSLNVYALSLKETFNYTQTQVEIIMSVGTFGKGLCFLESLCTLTFGYKVTCIILAIGLPLSSFLYALIAYYGQIFHQWPGIVLLIQLTLFILNNNAYVAVTKVFVDIYPREYTGTLVGCYMAACGFGKIYYALQMDFFFGDNLAGFFLSLSICSICFGVCFVILYPTATNKNRQAELGLNVSGAETTEKIADNKTQTPKDILLSPFLNVIFWLSVIFYSCSSSCVDNITTVAESIGLTNPLQTVYIASFAIVITRISFGILFDKFTSQWCGFTLLIVMYCSFIIAILTVLYGSGVSLMYLDAVAFGVAKSSGLVTPVSIILARVGRSYYSAVTSAFYVGSCTLVTLFQLMLGYLYDSEIRRLGLGGTTCYGRECFHGYFTVLLIITAAVIFVQTINFLVSSHFTRTKH